MAPVVDMAPDLSTQLSLDLTLTPPNIPNLTVTGGTFSITHVGVFGDVPGDTRTSVGRVTFDLPSDSGQVPFPDAPYGLYSRAGANLDGVEIMGTWRGRSLTVAFEVDFASVDLRVPAIEYGPGESATMSVTIDMSKWFDADDLDSCDSDGHGSIRIDPHHNGDVAEDIAQAIQGSFSLTTTSGR